MRKRIPGTTIFGDGNREAIRAEIHVISAGLTMEQVLNKCEDDEYILSAALTALEWLGGDSSVCSEGWAEMIAA